jgi:DNA replication protein DnaC
MLCEYCGSKYQNKEIELLDTKLSFNVFACDCKYNLYKEYERKKRIVELLQLSGIAEKHWDDTLQDFQWIRGYEPLQKVFNNYMENLSENIAKRKGLFIIGPRGTGKTRISCHILIQTIKNELMACQYITVAKLYRYFRDNDKRDRVIEQCVSVPVLLIDDLGESQIEYWNRNYLTEIINERYERKKVLFVNSMRSSEKLKDERFLGDHLLSRIIEMSGKGYIAEIKNDRDWRYEQNIQEKSKV